MDGPAVTLTTYGHTLAAAVHLVFALYLARLGYTRQGADNSQRWLLAAVVATSLWAGFSALEPHARSTLPNFAAAALDLARYGLWFKLLLTLLEPAKAAPGVRSGHFLSRVATVVLGSMALFWLYRAASGLYEADASRLLLVGSMVLPVLGLVLIEQLFRNLTEDARWSAKPLHLALAIVFLFDLYLFSEAVLFGKFDPDALSIRGAVHLLAVPLLLIAAQRRGDSTTRLQVSRSAAFHSATLLLAGGYLLLMSAMGYYVRYFGGEWGRALQLAVLTAALAGLAFLVLSGSARARLRVFVGKHFFSYRYDYREQWLNFTAMLSTHGSPQEVGQHVVRGLAGMVESPAGSLWTRAGSDDDYRQTARWNVPAAEDREGTDLPFSKFLRTQGWVVDVDEFRQSPRRYGELALPAWLLDNSNVWLVVPLLAGNDLLGFVTLARPRTPMELNWEVRDLLKTASRQAAGFLAQMHATEALLEARKFEAFNRMSAFVVHDLKNIITQLSLMMKNAQRLHDNPEFQQDMLLTVESSLDKMRRLMLQLREGATPPGGARGVELAPILNRLLKMAMAQGRQIEIRCAEGLATRGHEERLERVLGHLVQNALDATPLNGQVWLHASRFSGQVQVVVGDTGAGMSEDFVKNNLFRPFSTTKHSGMGIGSYESFQYIRELGGSIAAASAINRGTEMTVLIPLFDAQSGSDLVMSA